MKIATLHPCNEEYRDIEPDCDPAPYLPEASFTNFQIFKATAVKQVTEIAAQGFDVLFNLCDGCPDEDWPGLEVVKTLEGLNAAFTGAGSSFYDPTREAMKMAAYSCGVSTPAYAFARSLDEVNPILEQLRFPMIVKPQHGYSSYGITEDSRVTDEKGLRRQAKLMIEQFGGALVEEFIAGREFNVLVTEPRDGEELPWTFVPVQIIFPDEQSFRDYHAKWVDEPPMRVEEDAELGARLRRAASLIFEALGGSGYARCEWRVTCDGEIFFIEINPNHAMFYPKIGCGSADVSLVAESVGHRGFLEHVLYCAKRRQDRRRENIK